MNTKLVLAGAAGIALGWYLASSPALVPSAQASLPPAPEWSYFCFDAQNAAEVNQKANTAAARGWELLGGSPGRSGAIWCLRRPGLSPLREK